MAALCHSMSLFKELLNVKHFSEVCSCMDKASYQALVVVMFIKQHKNQHAVAP